MIRFGRHLPLPSFVHALDPRVKIGFAVVLSVVVLHGGFVCSSLTGVWLLLLVTTSRIPLRHLVRALRPAFIFLFLLFMIHLLSTDGTPIPPFSHRAVTVTFEGLHEGLLVSGRFAVLLAAGALLTMTTPLGELVDGLERLLRPLRVFGVRSYDIALMVSMALRFVPTLLDEMHRIREAQAARGASFSTGGPIRRIRAVTSLLIPTVLGALRRGDELAMAMESRGYQPGPRTTLRELRLTSQDYTAAVTAVLILVGISFGDAVFRGS